MRFVIVITIVGAKSEGKKDGRALTSMEKEEKTAQKARLACFIHKPDRERNMTEGKIH